MGTASYIFPPWEQVAERMYEILNKLCARMASNLIKKDELTHASLEVAQKYYTSEQRRRNMREFDGWLYWVCVSAARDTRRRLLQSISSVVPIIDDDADPEENPQGVPLHRFRCSELSDVKLGRQILFKRLLIEHAQKSDEHRRSAKSVWLQIWKGMKLPEIALFWYGSSDGAKDQAVRRLIKKDLDELKEELEDMGSVQVNNYEAT